MIMTDLFHETKQNSNSPTHYCNTELFYKKYKIKKSVPNLKNEFWAFFVNFPKLREKHKNKEYNLRSMI